MAINRTPEPATDIIGFLQRLPKVDIHCHLEGTVKAATFVDLAKKNGIELSAGRLREPYAFDTLREFFETYRLVCESIVEQDDFSRVIYEMLEHAAVNGNLKYCELFFSPTSHRLRYEAQIDGLIEGIKSAQSDFGVQCRLVPAIDRELSPAVALELVQRILAYRPEEVIGIGMDYDEAIGPPEMFVEAYKLAARGGLHRTAHAAAVSGPPRNVATCLDILGCERIDHGYNLIEDLALMSRVRDQGIPFTCCWSMSTVIGKLRYGGERTAREKWGEHYESHPIKTMISQELVVSLHTDDPAMINTDIGREYVAASNELGLSRVKMIQLCLSGVEAAWTDDTDKRAMRGAFQREIDFLSGELEIQRTRRG